MQTRLRFGICFALSELALPTNSQHTLTRNTPAHTTFIYSDITPSRPRSQSQPSPRRLQGLDRQLERNMHSKLRVTSSSWCGQRATLLRVIITLRPAITSAQRSANQKRTPSPVSSAFSDLCERLLLMNRKDTRQTSVHQSVEMFQCIQSFLRSSVALQPDMEDATTDRRADCRGRMTWSWVAAATRAANQMASDVRKVGVDREMELRVQKSREGGGEAQAG